MDVFFKDNHHVDSPSFVETDDKYSRELKEIIAKYYEGLDFSLKKVFQIEGSNINSGNYRIGDFYIKTIEHQNNKKYIESFPYIVKSLKQVDLPTIDFVTNVNGNEITRIDSEGSSQYLMVQKFCDAEFFSGELSELKEILSLFPKLLTIEPLSVDLKSISPYIKWNPFELYLRIEPLVTQNPSNVFVAENISLLREALEEYKLEIEGLLSLEKRFCHYDLHPHNLLFQNKKLMAIIDLESFVEIQPEIAYSFACYKLCRKCIVKGHSINDVRSIVGESGLEFAEIKTYSSIEVIRRILYILELSYLKKDKRWDLDLKKQFAGLKEIPSLFS